MTNRFEKRRSCASHRKNSPLLVHSAAMAQAPRKKLKLARSRTMSDGEKTTTKAADLCERHPRRLSHKRLRESRTNNRNNEKLQQTSCVQLLLARPSLECLQKRCALESSRVACCWVSCLSQAKHTNCLCATLHEVDSSDTLNRSDYKVHKTKFIGWR